VGHASGATAFLQVQKSDWEDGGGTNEKWKDKKGHRRGQVWEGDTMHCWPQ